MTPAAAKYLAFWVTLILAVILLTWIGRQSRPRAVMVRHEQAFLVCASAIRNASTHPAGVVVPRIEPSEEVKEVVFSWNWKTGLIQMPETGDKLFSYSGVCQVNKKTQQLISVFVMGAAW